ncbi:hypothetical protein [Parapedobacter indicus]|uniref:Cytochrome c domain-containing protein n=1 Tax=Parapedobacter indicus TaxID=1477437 RepID=A0A1I3F613_9SPHI|nr:hypothetical protein [Parapedobacter indicus]PPL03578.1 hypothetical protein CLV26_102183 [Parapedobacter indicus]SFI06669.1 hypothetical protein SAMN05444682_102183 [Parapedobacter indicus]
MKRLIKSALWVALVAACLAGCGKDDPTPETPPGKEDGVTVENVTYKNFVGGLFESRCAKCHAGSGPGTVKWVFSGYESVRDNLSRINDMVIVRKLMPQDGSLTNNQLTLLKAWIEKDAPQ